ncbi:hypothetical protein EVAR_56996_1 [Eumeta japonica]|uniref:Uncharacterized protein n=1 Tax=Eumeta variegata TaxID=151549 RepID=A0A4C1Z9J5_EUMVA|nr:hypothetical protein EVAR_56996_1 [Eumeta japonica]
MFFYHLGSLNESPLWNSRFKDQRTSFKTRNGNDTNNEVSAPAQKDPSRSRVQRKVFKQYRSGAGRGGRPDPERRASRYSPPPRPRRLHTEGLWRDEIMHYSKLVTLIFLSSCKVILELKQKHETVSTVLLKSRYSKPTAAGARTRGTAIAMRARAAAPIDIDP